MTHENNLEEYTNLPVSEQSFEPVPQGLYTVQATTSEIKTTKSGTGTYAKFELEILGPTHAGRKLFVNFNLKNDNDKAAQIGRGQLSAFGKACGLDGMPSSTYQLHSIPVTAKVVVKPAKDGYDASNEVKGFYPVEGAVKAKAPTAAAIDYNTDEVPF